MTEILSLHLPDGSVVGVEARSDASPGPVPAGPQPRADAEQTLIDQVSRRLWMISEALLRPLREIASTPSEVEVSFGITLDAKVGMIVTHAKGEANFSVVIKWKNDASDGGRHPG